MENSKDNYKMGDTIDIDVILKSVEEIMKNCSPNAAVHVIEELRSSFLQDCPNDSYMSGTLGNLSSWGADLTLLKKDVCEKGVLTKEDFDAAVEREGIRIGKEIEERGYIR